MEISSRTPQRIVFDPVVYSISLTATEADTLRDILTARRPGTPEQEALVVTLLRDLAELRQL